MSCNNDTTAYHCFITRAKKHVFIVLKYKKVYSKLFVDLSSTSTPYPRILIFNFFGIFIVYVVYNGPIIILGIQCILYSRLVKVVVVRTI